MLPLVATLAGIAGDWLQGRRDAAQDKRQIVAAVNQRRAELAKARTTHNQNWELRALEGKDSQLQRVSFAILTFPFIWAAFDPAGVSNYFKTVLSVVPDWYIGAYLTALGAIWASAKMREFKTQGTTKSKP
jgi:type II secretory pathway pseudopilin PulG